MNLSNLKRPLLAIKQWIFGPPLPEVSMVVEGMLSLFELVPDEMVMEFERGLDGIPSAVFIRYGGPRKWLEGNLQAVRVRLTATGMWLDMPAQEMVELNWVETELLQEAIDAWVNA